MQWVTNFQENMKLRKERNTFENKYHVIQDKYICLLENKTNQTEEIQKYKDLCMEQKKQIRKQKSIIADLKIQIEKLKSRKKRNEI